MKKLILPLLAIMALAGCSWWGTQPVDINQPLPDTNASPEPKPFVLADYNDQAQKAMPDWFDLWSRAYENFSLADFNAAEPLTIEYYEESEYKEFPDPEPGYGKLVRLTSPDNKYLVLIAYGGEPDSGVGIVNLESNRIKHFTQLQCGTPCIFINGLWLDNDRFLVAGHGEAYPFGYEQSVASGEYYDAPFIYLVDLAKNTIVAYNHPKPISQSTFFSLRDSIAEQQAIRDNLKKLIPLGYFSDAKTQGIAYLKTENHDLLLYKYINGEKINTKISLFKIHPRMYDIISAVISPQGDKIAYYIYDGDFGLYKTLYYLDLNDPLNPVLIFSGSEHHFDLRPDFFFNSTGDKLLYYQMFGDEFSSSMVLSEYNFATKQEGAIKQFMSECDEDFKCTGEASEMIPLGYAQDQGQEAVFYAVNENDRYIVYKNDQPFTRINNTPIEIVPALMGHPRIGRNSDYVYFLEDNDKLKKSSLGELLEPETQTGPHGYEFLLAESELPGPHGGLNSQFQVSPFDDDVLYVNSSGAEGWLENKLYSLEDSEKKLIDSFEFNENDL